MGETLPVLTMTWLSTEKNQRMATLRLADTVLWFSTKWITISFDASLLRRHCCRYLAAKSDSIA